MILPHSKPQASRQLVIARLIKAGLWSDQRISRCSVVGVRGYYQDSMGKPGMNDRDIYDDAVFVIAPKCFGSFNFNTDPQGFQRGRATLESPQIVKYIQGYHGYGRASGHPAFRQASDVIVRRDYGIGNGIALGDGRFADTTSSRFWINIHRGGWNSTSSAGCQTVPPQQWDDFYSLVCEQMALFGQPNFTYYLFDGPIT